MLRPMKAILLLALFLAACACTAERAPAPRDAGVAPVPILNFAKLTDGVYRGSQPDAAGFQALKDLGVRTIVNLRSHHDDRPLVAPAGLTVINIPLKADLFDADPPTEEEVRAFFDIVNDPALQPVFVHCAHGKDRTGTMCAIYRMENDGWTAEAALEEMRTFGYHEKLYGELREYVLAYKPKGLCPKR